MIVKGQKELGAKRQKAGKKPAADAVEGWV